MLRVRQILARGCAFLPGAHPSFDELIAIGDGELDEKGMARVTAHLKLCSRCRDEAGRLGWGPDGFPGTWREEARPAPPAEEGLRRLLEALGDKQQLAEARERLFRERNSRIVYELGLYFGRYPEVLLKGSVEAEITFEVSAGRLARAFLGERTASTLFGRIDAELGIV